MATGMHLKTLHIPLLACVLLSGGCSCLIAESGKDLTALTTKEQVHQSLGAPKLTGVAEGQPFEEFESRQKIADPMRAATDSMSVMMTYGFGEVVALPQELYLLCSRTLFGETIRVIGRAVISTDPELCASFELFGKTPRCVLVITVERAFYQCTKAIIRSKLWDPAMQVERASLPTPGKILAEITGGKMGGEEHDRTAPERIKQTIY